jgi:uncharacterized membrane protein
MDIGKSIRRSFWKGMAALLPALMTFALLVFCIRIVHAYFGQYVNEGVVLILAWSLGWTTEDAQLWFDDHMLGWTGVVVAIIILCLVAYIVGTFLGGHLLRLLESWVVRLPVLRKIYPGAKQVSEFFFSERAVEFRRVVAIQFPRQGMWMVGFVTGRALKQVSGHAGGELLSVFIPFTPAPVTGYVVMVPRQEILDLDISVDEAFQYLISAGVVMPPAERVESLKEGLQMSHEEAHALVEAAKAKAARAAYPEDEADAPPPETPRQDEKPR